jgi:hypothetical protein
MQVLSAAGHGSDHIVGGGVEDLSEAGEATVGGLHRIKSTTMRRVAD